MSTEQKVFLPQVLPLLILMQNIETKAPSYVMEKVERSYGAAREAYRLLDAPNSRRLLQWLSKWHAEDSYTPEELQEIRYQAGEI